MVENTSTVVLVHVIAMGTGLGLIAIVLIRKGLFDWTHTGFWAWASFGLYYFLSPLVSIVQGTTWRYEERLSLAGGASHAYWILLVISLGILIYFVSYLRTTCPTVRWNFAPEQSYSLPKYLLLLLPFTAFAFYSLWFFRSGMATVDREMVIQNGRFVGGVIGYEDVGHLFLYFPVVLLILQDRRVLDLAGWILTLAYIILTLPIGSARYATVSIVIALAISDAVRRGRKWPRLSWVFAIVMLAAVLQLRGHTRWDISALGSSVLGLTPQTLNSFPAVLGSQDTSMLATFYLESYYREIVGYNYGLPTINYVLTGWIPGRLFPQKYFLVDWLNSQTILQHDYHVENLLRFSKSTLIGGFYSDGNLIAVLCEMALVGFLTRKMDGMLALDAPLLVKTVAICWISVLWMIWGSALTWGLIRIGLFFMPALMLRVVSEKVKPVKKHHISLAGQKSFARP